MAVQEQMESPEPEPNEKHTLRSRKSLTGQISDTLFQITKVPDKGNTKPSIVKALISKLETLKWLVEREDTEKRDETLIENKTRKTQHDTDAAEIATLKERLCTLESKALEVRTVTTPDPEAARLREQNAALSALLKTVTDAIPRERRSQIAIRVIQSLS